jgi:FKBP-type peptidyl-prolyl cis-trans isomerase
MEAYGWLVGQQAGFEMGFSPTEKESLLKGLSSAASGEKAPARMKELFPKMQEYLSTKEKAYREVQLAKMAEEAKSHIADGQKYLAEIAKLPGVQKTKSGLYYKIELPGNAKRPTTEDVVTIHYTGKLIDGTVFDSSVERGQPVDLPLYGVIPGFSEGLGLIGEGGKATLYIPSELAYGNQAAGPIPPGSTLTFTVELIKIQPKQAVDTAKSDASAQAMTIDAKPVPAADVKPAKTESK